MTNEKKIAFQQKIIDDLTEQVNALKAENAEYKSREDKVVEANDRFNQMIEELKELRHKYNDALKEFVDLKANYKRDMKKEIKRLKKQK